MITNLSGCRTPKLVTMEGKSATAIVPLLMGMETRDRQIVSKGYITPVEHRYLKNKYPELMGFLPLLLAALPAVLTGVSALITATKGKNTPQNNELSASAVLQAQLQQQQQQQQQTAALKAQQDQTVKTLMMVGIPAAALLVIVLAMNKRKR